MSDEKNYQRLIPFLVPQTVPDGYTMGRGIIRRVTIGSANTDIPVIHNLGRIPNFVLILDPGTAGYVQWKRGSGAWTTNKVYLQFNATGNVILWIV